MRRRAAHPAQRCSRPPINIAEQAHRSSKRPRSWCSHEANRRAQEIFRGAGRIPCREPPVPRYPSLVSAPRPCAAAARTAVPLIPSSHEAGLALIFFNLWRNQSTDLKPTALRSEYDEEGIACVRPLSAFDRSAAQSRHGSLIDPWRSVVTVRPAAVETADDRGRQAPERSC